ncbi:MAG: hypothetical protein M3O55_05045 [Actinomycetota bacterium]|nr:hypothetical protein [Actinomycetota bacterium]
MKWVNSTGAALELTGAVGFCVQTTSNNGATFAYNSSLGGVQAKGSSCP